MNKLAEELNKVLKGTQIESLLSSLGRRLYFPKGIVAQAGEANAMAHRHNATAGMAFENGEPILLSGIKNSIQGIELKDYITYAPTPGVKNLRDRWLEEIFKKNPSLKGCHTSTPIVVPGLTSGISNTADLFLDPGDNIVVPDLHWGNYKLILEARKEVNIRSFSFFNEKNKINTVALKEALLNSVVNNKVSVLLNFPNNPTGYAPTKLEAEEIAKILSEVADTGVKILVITDDAYFGLFYEENIYKESIFTLVANLHSNILGVKVDGATKEDYAWGLRVGFITFAGKGITKKHTDALEQKLTGSVRSSFSNSPKLSQALVLKCLNSKTYHQEKAAFEKIMRDRYLKVKEILSNRTTGLKLKEYPFNSGYFMNFKTEKGFNEKLRQELLKKGVGTISLGETSFRIAFSTIDKENLEDLFATVFQTADNLQ